MTKELPLSQGKVALVDDDVYEWASVHKWRLKRDEHRLYARRDVGKRVVMLHREIMEASPQMKIDHKNGNGLDCRRDNMRIATSSQNGYNGRIRSDNKSGYRGVSWYKPAQKWRAQIRVDGRKVHLGLFISVMDAARAYDGAAKKYHSEFANTNFDVDGEL